MLIIILSNSKVLNYEFGPNFFFLINTCAIYLICDLIFFYTGTFILKQIIFEDLHLHIQLMMKALTHLDQALPICLSEKLAYVRTCTHVEFLFPYN